MTNSRRNSAEVRYSGRNLDKWAAKRLFRRLHAEIRPQGKTDDDLTVEAWLFDVLGAEHAAYNVRKARNSARP